MGCDRYGPAPPRCGAGAVGDCAQVDSEGAGMAGQIFGLDFGTTNSLLSVIGRDGRPIHLTDEKDRPHPSVVWYRGGDVIVGRRARENLDGGAEAITGSFVRSPKRLLDQDAPIHVGGRD